MDVAETANDEKHDVHRTVQPADTFTRHLSLTMPLTVGPGSISVAITLGANVTHHHIVPSFDNLGCPHWIGVDRDQHFALAYDLPTVGANPGSNGMTVITQLSSFSSFVSVCRLLGTGSKHCWSR